MTTQLADVRLSARNKGNVGIAGNLDWVVFGNASCLTWYPLSCSQLRWNGNTAVKVLSVNIFHVVWMISKCVTLSFNNTSQLNQFVAHQKYYFSIKSHLAPPKKLCIPLQKLRNSFWISRMCWKLVVSGPVLWMTATTSYPTELWRKKTLHRSKEQKE